MPIVQLTQVNASVSFALWKIEESLEGLVALYPFSKEDMDVLNEQKLPVRKMEWLAARLALKALLEKAGLIPYSIVKDDFGKPHLRGCSTQISISHTSGFGAAIINTAGPVGIDIEYPREQIRRITHKFLHMDEKTWAGDDIQRLTQIWSAKEALYKLHGRTQLTFATQLYIDKPSPFFPVRGSIQENHQQDHFKLSYHQLGELTICAAY